MSVLKYNNNGTWEGLNIDHASTADSCLYDSNGDVIASTYLPLTAGSSKPLTGDLSIDRDSGSNTTLNLKEDSTLKGQVQHNSTGAYTGLCATNSGGTALSGINAYEAGDVRIYGNAQPIRIRPNGAGSATGQTAFSANGEVTFSNHLYQDAGEQEVYHVFKYNGTQRGSIYTSGSTGSYPALMIRAYNGSTAKASIQLDSNIGYAIVAGDGVYLRPNGLSSTTNQLYMPTSGPSVFNGDIRRTAQVYSASQTSSKSLSSGNTKICGTSVAQAGVYLISASGHIAMTGGGNAYFNIYKSTDASSKIVYDNHYVKAGSTWVTTMTWATFNANSNISLYCEVTTACTIDNVYLELIRIA